jgi:metal-sulfur cluster biosynthetic enzyme
MTDRTIEEIASDAADTAAPDDATSASVVTDSVPAESAPAASVADSGTAVSKAAIADIEEAMKDVVDPELGINVVDLGLVYGVHVDDENVVTLDMTLTSAACPLTDVIEDQTRQALTSGPGGGLVPDFRINWVWLPPWGPDKITDDGRDQLRSLGFNV